MADMADKVRKLEKDGVSSVSRRLGLISGLVVRRVLKMRLAKTLISFSGGSRRDISPLFRMNEVDEKSS